MVENVFGGDGAFYVGEGAGGFEVRESLGRESKKIFASGGV